MIDEIDNKLSAALERVAKIEARATAIVDRLILMDAPEPPRGEGDAVSTSTHRLQATSKTVDRIIDRVDDINRPLAQLEMILFEDSGPSEGSRLNVDMVAKSAHTGL